MSRRACVLILWCFVAAVSVAEERATEAFPDGFDERRYYALLAELRCLVCQNQSLADSDAGLASDLREQVKTMLADGASDDEIKAFMTSRYGDFVLYDPPLDSRTYILWLAPFVLLALVLTLLLRRGLRQQRELEERS